MNLEKVKFHFRANAEGVKRQSVEVELPMLEASDLFDVLEDEDKRLTEFVLECINAEVITAARKQVDAGSDEVDLDKLTIQSLAYTPKASRSLGISKELWKEFYDDYIATAVNAGKSEEGATKTATLLKNKCTPVRTNVQILELLGELLDTWYSETTSAEKFTSIYEYLSERIQTLRDDAKTVNLQDFLA